MYLVDSHCHFELLKNNPHSFQADEYIVRANEMGVCFFLNVCVKMSELSSMKRLSETQSSVALSVGLHPNDVQETVDQGTLIVAAQHPKVIAIGETGLDYYRQTGDLEWQRNRFRDHIRAAKELKLPLIIHTRQAADDTMNILREEGAETVGGVMHCFTEDWDTAKKALDLGFYISFSGIVTFKNAEAIQNVAKQVPMENILVETDSPYLAPVPYRGKPNEPAYVRYVAEYLAELKQVDFHAFAKQTTDNFFKLFKKAEKTYV